MRLRLRMRLRPSGFAVISALRRFKSDTLMPLLAAADAAGVECDWSGHALVPLEEARKCEPFVEWITRYNAMSVCTQAHTPLSACCTRPLCMRADAFGASAG
jgi:hypothetical protein